MSNVIIWKTAEEIIELLASQNALVAGMSITEAAAALGFTRTASGVYVKTLMTTAANSVTATSAAQAASAATGVTATTTATNLVLLEGGAGGTATVGGLASMALPAAAVVAAAAGGYLIGDTIYEANPSILDGILLPLFNFVTGNHLTSEDMYEYDHPTVPIIFDVEGNTYMDGAAVEAVRRYIQSQSTSPLYQKWNSYPDSPVLTSDYPYQCIGVVSGKISIIYTTQPIYYLDNDRIRTATANMYYRNLVGGVTWSNTVQSVGIVVINMRPLLSNILQANNPIYTDSSLTTVFFGATSGPALVPPTGVTPYTLPTPPELPPLPGWTPIVLPQTQPGVLPGGVPLTPDYVPDPSRITPLINPQQPPIIDIPIPEPPGTPSSPVVPVIDPTPDTSNEPSPSPDPNKDPSQLPETSPSTDPVQLPEPSNTGGTNPPLLPIIPSISSAATGLLHVYNPSNEEINAFGAWLWTTFSGDLIDTLSKLFNNPMDAVIGLHELYATPATSGIANIRAGYLDSGVASQLVSQRYTEINCGAVSVPEYWGNYLDYAPYTKAFCYLPFIGIVELNADDIIGGGVEITYKIDAYNGSCIAIITTAKAGSPESITYQYPGNCAVEIPITSGMKSAMQGALIGAATLAVGAATGGAGGIVGAAMIGGVQGAARKNLVQHSGSFGSSYGAMGSKKPFLIIKRPKQKVVPGYNTNYGYPAHKMVLISSCSGYLKAIEVDVVSPTATEEEKHLIEKELKSGIFVN